MVKDKKMLGELVRPLALHIFLLREDMINKFRFAFIADGISYKTLFKGKSCFLALHSVRKLEVTLKYTVVVLPETGERDPKAPSPFYK